MAADDPQVFVVYDTPSDGWQIDGAHSVDSDLTRTYQILNRLSEPKTLLRLTIGPDGWPSFEDVTETAKGAGKAEPLPWG